MNNFCKKTLDGVIIATSFCITLGGIVYAATIVNVSPQTISSGDIMSASWYQDVNNQLLGLSGNSSIPTGAVMAFNLSVCPEGWKVADGTNGNPDLRGEFIRGLDNGRGIDAGRVLASWQVDDFKSHTHNISAGVGGTSGTYGRYSGNLSDVQSSPSGGNETRPRNIALLYCVKD